MSLIVEKFVTTGFGRSTPAPNSQLNYRRHITQFENFLKLRAKTAVDGTIDKQDILDYAEHLNSKYKPNTVAVRIAAIKSYFRWLKKEGIISHAPCIPSQPKGDPEFKELSTEDLDIATKHLEGDDIHKIRDKALFALGVYCDFKTEEIAAINAEDVDFSNNEITVKTKKRSKNRTKIQIEQRSFGAALTEMKNYANSKQSHDALWKPDTIQTDGIKIEKEPFFLNKFCTRISGRSIRRRLMGGSDMSFNTPFSMRDLRHTYIKNMEKIVEIEENKEKEQSFSYDPNYGTTENQPAVSN